MTSVMKLNVLHKQIMLMFQGETLINAGHLTGGWKKNDHIQHTADSLENKINLLQRQIDNTDLTSEDQGQLKSFKGMLERDLKNMIFNIQNGKLPDELVQVAKQYLNQMKDMIQLLDAAID